MANAQDILMGGGVPSVSFAEMGDGITGTIVRIHDARQVTDMVTGKRKWWDGDKQTQPIETVPIEIKSDADGNNYMLYVQQSHERQKALARAVRESGATEVAVGARIGMRWSGSEASSIPNVQDKKLYQAFYQPPASRSSAVLMEKAPAPAPAPAQKPAQSEWPTSAPTMPDTPTPSKNTLDLANLSPEAIALLQELANKK